MVRNPVPAQGSSGGFGAGRLVFTRRDGSQMRGASQSYLSGSGGDDADGRRSQVVLRCERNGGTVPCRVFDEKQDGQLRLTPDRIGSRLPA